GAGHRQACAAAPSRTPGHRQPAGAGQHLHLPFSPDPAGAPAAGKHARLTAGLEKRRANGHLAAIIGQPCSTWTLPLVLSPIPISPISASSCSPSSWFC